MNQDHTSLRAETTLFPQAGPDESDWMVGISYCACHFPDFIVSTFARIEESIDSLCVLGDDFEQVPSCVCISMFLVRNQPCRSKPYIPGRCVLTNIISQVTSPEQQ